MTEARRRDLIIVAGHAVFIGGDPNDERAWMLQPFQVGEPPFYVEHIRAGVALAGTEPTARLVFSGGQTRCEAGRASEAEGYRQVARHFHWWGEAVRWPVARFVFHGVNQPVDLAGAERGEAEAIAAFARDPYGMDPADLGRKRVERNPFGRVPPYAESCPEVGDLLRHAGPAPFAGRLPWD